MCTRVKLFHFISETTTNLKKTEKQLSTSEKERDEFETAVERLRKTLDETKKMNKNLQEMDSSQIPHKRLLLLKFGQVLQLS